MIEGKFKPVASACALAVTALLMGTPLAATAASKDMIVIYKPGSAASVRAAVAQAGGTVVREIRRVNALAVRVPSKAVKVLKANKGVEIVEADAERHTMRKKPARNALVLAASPAVADPEVVPYGITAVQADQLSDAATGNRTLCIIDSGVDAGHEDHVGNQFVGGVNLTASGEWYTDENTHGTHVAGTIAAIGGNGVGVVGVNPGGHLNIYIAKVFDASGSAPSSVIMDAVSACADAGANVISMSLGGGSPTWGERRLYKQLAKDGVLTIAAAGNGGSQTVSFPAGYADVMSVAAIDESMTVASFSQYNRDVEISGPGVAVLSTIPPNVDNLSEVSVGGVAYDSAPMSGSPRASVTGELYNFGTGEADDPGVAGKVCLIQRGNISFADKVTRCEANGGIGAIVYNNTAGMLFGTLGAAVTGIPSVGTSDVNGAAMLTQLGQSATVTVAPDPAKYAYFNGTSMATPHVSGVAALVWSYFPGCSGGQIRDALNMTALDLGDPGYDIHYGNGLVQAKAAYDYLSVHGCAAP